MVVKLTGAVNLTKATLGGTAGNVLTLAEAAKDRFGGSDIGNVRSGGAGPFHFGRRTRRVMRDESPPRHRRSFPPSLSVAESPVSRLSPSRSWAAGEDPAGAYPAFMRISRHFSFASAHLCPGAS